MTLFQLYALYSMNAQQADILQSSLRLFNYDVSMHMLHSINAE
jgi:hypothetical protein